LLFTAVLLRSPELLLELPLRILTWIPAYVEFAVNRFMSRIERELGLSSAVSESGSQGQAAARPASASAQPVTLIGLAIAGIYAMRK
jgi:hypothetical protein